MKLRSSCQPLSECKQTLGIRRRRWLVLPVATLCAIVNLCSGVEGFQQHPACFGLKQHRATGYGFPRLFIANKASMPSSNVKKDDDNSQQHNAAQKKKQKKKGRNKKDYKKKKDDKSKKEKKEGSKKNSSKSSPKERTISKRRKKKAKQKIEKLDDEKYAIELDAVQEQELVKQENLGNGKGSEDVEITEDQATIRPNAATDENESHEAAELEQIRAEEVATDASDLGQHVGEEGHTNSESQPTQQGLSEEDYEQIEVEQVVFQTSGTVYEAPVRDEDQLLQRDNFDGESVQIGTQASSVDGSDSIYEDYEENEEEETYVSPSDFSIAEHFELTTPSEDEFRLEENQRLVCIGDVHGDFHKFEESLKIAGVYDKTKEDCQWVGGNTILVQCGDVLDRGSQELACFYLLANLSRQAAENGGHVIGRSKLV